MDLLHPLALGQYLPGESWLHRLDPRLKLAGLPLLVAATFAARGPERLLAMALLATALILLAGGHWRRFLKGAWALRWLLLFTLVLHLFFSPGRTLAGVSWLSLDGLQRGAVVAGQLLLVLTFSSLLALTTSPLALASAMASLLSPLKRLRLPVEEWASLLLLVLHFIPILREEGVALAAQSRARGEMDRTGGLIGRGRALGRLLGPLVLRVVDRADRLAVAIARGEETLDRVPGLSPWRQAGWRNWGAALGGASILALIFGVLP